MHPELKIKEATFCEFGFAEEVIGFIKYDSGDFEVGIGESLRPYQRLYFGRSESAAEERFWESVTVSVRMI
jgi:hypothetical protein